MNDLENKTKEELVEEVSKLQQLLQEQEETQKKRYEEYLEQVHMITQHRNLLDAYELLAYQREMEYRANLLKKWMAKDPDGFLEAMTKANKEITNKKREDLVILEFSSPGARDFLEWISQFQKNNTRPPWSEGGFWTTVYVEAHTPQIHINHFMGG